jgi:hypothetical protein
LPFKTRESGGLLKTSPLKAGGEEILVVTAGTRWVSVLGAAEKHC